MPKVNTKPKHEISAEGDWTLQMTHQTSPTIYIGIDPGQKGGLVALSPLYVSGAKVPYVTGVRYEPMPTTDRDVLEWFKSLPSGPQKVAYIEKVHSSPQMGVTSSFTFGRGVGFLTACLHSQGIRFEEVSPQAWLKGLSIPSGKKKGVEDKEWKNHLRDKAQQLFPELEIWKVPRSKGIQLAISDALLIAEFCRRSNP